MANFAALALRLISKNGRDISLRFQSGSTPIDPLKPWLGVTPATTDVATKGVFVDPKATDFLARVSAVSRLVLSPVETERVRVLIPGTVTTEPDMTMKVVDGGKVWGIASVSSVKPGNDVALWIIELVN